MQFISYSTEELETMVKQMRNIINDRKCAVEKKETMERIGKCYKYRNSSCGNEWWVYLKIIGYKNQSIQVQTFEKTGDSTIEFQNTNCYTLCSENGYIKITPKQYSAALARVIKSLDQFK